MFFVLFCYNYNEIMITKILYQFLQIPKAQALLDLYDGIKDECIQEGLCNMQDLFQLVGNGFKILAEIAVIATVLMVIYNGFNYMTALDKDDRKSKAIKGIIDAIIGLLIALLAWVIVHGIQTLISGFYTSTP